MSAVGDVAVGKTCLLERSRGCSIPGDCTYTTRPVDNVTSLIYGGDLEPAEPFNTPTENYAERIWSYCYTDVFLFCFDDTNRESLENIRRKWYPEVERYCPTKAKILVGCKTDLRQGPGHETAVSYEDGSALASTLGMKYFETSALAFEGIEQCFEEAVKWLLREPEKRTVSGKFGKSADVVPWPEIETSKFADHWYHLLEDPKFSDVTFLLDDRRQLDAHKIMLSSASEVFAQILQLPYMRKERRSPSSRKHTREVTSRRARRKIRAYEKLLIEYLENSKLKMVKETETMTRDDLNSGKVEGVTSVSDTDCKTKPGHVTIQLSADITAAIFTHVLEFLYTGTPRLPDYVSVQYLEDVIRVANIFKLPHLVTNCRNAMKGKYYVNHRITTSMNGETASNIKKLHLNQPEVADVVFDIEGREVFAHKAVLVSRCDVMAAMFGGSFIEAQQSGKCKVKIPNTTYECFLAFLEYLYTDHAPIKGGDAVGILVLADEYCQPRLLNLCELYITEEVDRSCTENIEKAEIDVIGLLLTAQRHNASQLSKWCLHFISTNYIAFSNRPEFVMLTGDNKTYVEENRWPPVDYVEVEEVEEYKRKKRKQRKMCSVM